MPWHAAVSLPFTRIEVVARVPAASGVYAIMEDGTHRFFGSSWNLRARLLELANVLREGSLLSVKFELCPEGELLIRKAELLSEFRDDILPGRKLPGITLLEDQTFRSV